MSAPGRSYEDLGLTTVYDTRADAGPLAGIEAALTACEADFAAFAPCDISGLQSAWYEPLEQAVAERSAAAFYDERWHLFAVFHRATRARVAAHLDAQQRAVRRLLDELGVRVAPPANFATLRSINRPEDLP